MDQFHLFDLLPLWVTFLAIILLVLVSAVIGIYIARSRRKAGKQDDEGPIGAVVSATLGLLAFILAFTFGLTASRFDNRKQLLLDEVTAIETTALRADLIPEPHRTQTRELLRRYVEIRLEAINNRQAVRQLITKSEDLQQQIWAHAAALSEADLKNADITSLFVDSVNEMANLQTRRVTTALYHIPALVWVVLFCVTILSMVEVGYLFGRSENVNWLFLTALSLAFSGVMLLIVDLDRSGASTAGAIQVSQQPLVDLHRRLYGSAPK